MNKTLTEYLSESTKTYWFKLKIAGEIDEHIISDKLPLILQKFGLLGYTEAYRTPIQSTPPDFPNMENTRVTSWDFEVKYPTITPILENIFSTDLGIPAACVLVHTPTDPLELERMDIQKQSPLLNTDDMGAAQETAWAFGTDVVLSGLLADLLTHPRKLGNQYKGVNDCILADSAPAVPLENEFGLVSPLSARPVKFVDPYKGK